MGRSVLRICVARARIARRLLREHAFVLFVLGPMILGAVAWVGERYLDLLRGPVADLLRGDGGFPDRSALLFALVIGAVLWPSTRREVFGAGGREELLDALPVSEAERFWAAAATVAGRALLLCAVLVLGLWAVERGDGLFHDRPSLWILLPLAVLTVAALDLLGVLVSAALFPWVARRSGRILVGAVVWVSVPWIRPELLWPFLPWALPGAAIEAAVIEALGGPSATTPLQLAAGPWLLVLEGAAVIALAGVVFVKRRRGALERAAAGASRERRALPRLPAGIRRRVSPGAAAQLRRDVTMILRGFSSAVPTALGVSLLSHLALPVLAFDPSLADEHIRRAMVLVAFVGGLAVVSVVPFLLKAQLPVFWLEKSTGVALEHVWQTKLWLAALLAAPQALVSALLVVFLAPGDAAELTVAVLQVLVNAGIAAALVGTAVFEIAEEPVLGLLFSGFVSGAVASLMIFYPQAWWLWLIFFGYLVSQVAGRASRRVRFTEVET